MIRSLFLQPNPKKPVLKKLILWVKPETGSASVFSQKFSELIPDEATAAGFRLIEYQPERQLKTGEKVWVEWQVEGVSTIMLEPLSETPVDSTGSQCCPRQGVNCVDDSTRNRTAFFAAVADRRCKRTP